jgi:hypothetical protein
MKRVIILALALTLLVSSTSFAARRDRDENAIQYSTSIGLGTAFPLGPDEFDNNWDPSFGLVLEVAASKRLLELAANFDYSFFLSNTDQPNDVNTLAAFLNLKIKPLKSTARPYIFVGGGYFRYWIVDENLYDNVLGFGGGAGVEVEVDKTRRIFIEAKTIHGRTRKSARKANTEILPIRAGITFAF